MIEVVQSETFKGWLAKLKDRQAIARINARIRRVAESGNFGDAKSARDGVSEMRIDYGPGYRIYFVQRGPVIVDSDPAGRWRQADPGRRYQARDRDCEGLEGLNMAEKFTRWDAADYIESEEDMALYLDACLDEDPGDGSLVRAALNDIARACGMSQLARDTGLTREGLYKALSATGNPEFSTMLKVIKALKIKLHAAPATPTKPRRASRKKGDGELAAA